MIVESRKLDQRAAPGAHVRSDAAISQKQLFWRQFRRHKLALASAAVLLVLAAVVLLAPWIAPYPFDAIDTTQFRKPPSLAHIMGTDDIGRDLFTRLLYGGRGSLPARARLALLRGRAGPPPGFGGRRFRRHRGQHHLCAGRGPCARPP